MFRLYSHIFLVKGHLRGLMFDGQRGKFYYVPNDLIDRLISNNYLIENLNELDEAFKSTMLENDLVFEVDSNDMQNFPPINLEWDYSAKIHNASIEVSELAVEHIQNLHHINRIATFNLIVSNYSSPDSIKKVTDFIQSYECDSAQLSIVEKLKPELIEALGRFLNQPDFNRLVVIRDMSDEKNDLNNFVKIDSKRNELIDTQELPIEVSKNAQAYYEAQKHHLFFNRKLSISRGGKVKNSLELDNDFGRLKDYNSGELFDGLFQTDKFNYLWNIRKDEMLVCRDCELRYNCVDNRLPLTNGSFWYNATECNYNPYLAKFSDETGFVNLEDSGVSLTFEGEFTIDEKKLSEVVNSTWYE